jgi:hypothetical protein
MKRGSTQKPAAKKKLLRPGTGKLAELQLMEEWLKESGDVLQADARRILNIASENGRILLAIEDISGTRSVREP